MRDPAGELSEGFHLLGLQELLLQPRALGNLQFEFRGPILHAIFQFETGLLQRGIALLKNTLSGLTSVTVPAELSVKPPGSFIHALAATTDTVPPIPEMTIGMPVQKCGHGRSRRQP